MGSPEATAAAVTDQVHRGITTMMPSEDALWVGRDLGQRFGLPFWQVAMTATEANRYVIRICRTLTRRPKIHIPHTGHPSCLSVTDGRFNALRASPVRSLVSRCSFD